MNVKEKFHEYVLDLQPRRYSVGIPTDEFKSGLCMWCVDATIGCKVLICPCFSHRKVAEELDYKRPWLWCLVSFLFCLFPPLLTIPSAIQRMKIRKVKHIRGNILGDCCASCFCRCCVMAQNEHEMEPVDSYFV
ncbi:Oidioi.mRNA.OKI2018_I69.chr1.g966.t1.cds [Oikopleura dioica]|uniref:Oidioi.mRNA.OKI2018_I69.chr1.g966.t1.cds n=1 Tax=Oikopleura dioica TaxID=34765 RepID=A0ABN7SQU0_OIKDI|nr:Oidioi.mRNA.OKI2018_I69.chr1.g966.t1.cds [Oikopleura dioica]